MESKPQMLICTTPSRLYVCLVVHSIPIVPCAIVKMVPSSLVAPVCMMRQPVMSAHIPTIFLGVCGAFESFFAILIYTVDGPGLGENIAVDVVPGQQHKTIRHEAEKPVCGARQKVSRGIHIVQYCNQLKTIRVLPLRDAQCRGKKT